MIIQNEKIYLRPFFEKELQKIYEILLGSDLDEHTTPFWVPRNLEWIKKKFLIETDDNSSRYKLAICCKQDESEIPIGFMDIFNINYRDSRAEIGIALFQLENRGKGFGTESLSTIIDWCFNSLNINRLSAKCFSNNEISKRLFENQGFIIEGILKDHFYVKGTFEDAIIMGLTKKRWLSFEDSK